MLNEIIARAIENRADQVFIAVNTKPKMRTMGRTETLDLDVTTLEDMAELLAELNCEAVAPAYNFSYANETLGRLRINVLKQRGTYAIAIRIHKKVVPEKSLLNIPEKVFETISKNTGLFLVTGQSASGKSTTIAALVKHIIETECAQVITCENAIEYLLKHDLGTVLQREVGIDCDTLYDGVVSAILHDPDVLVIGEIHDEAMLNLALRIAESGKRVIAGYSAKNAITALERLLITGRSNDLLRRFQLSNGLIGILAQQLIEVDSGSGWVLVPELLLMNSAIKDHIQTNQLAEIQNSLISGRRQGMVSMESTLVELYKLGKIDFDALMHYAANHDHVKRLIEDTSL